MVDNNFELTYNMEYAQCVSIGSKFFNLNWSV